MKNMLVGALATSSTLLSPLAAHAETEVHFWHAFGGRLGELVAAQVEDFNASQSDYVVVQSRKGNYYETLTEGRIRFSPDTPASKALNILQTNQISAAFVVEENQPVGLVSMLQLLQQGVA